MFAVDLETIHNEVGGELSAAEDEEEETDANGYESVTLKVKREKPSCGIRVVVYFI